MNKRRKTSLEMINIKQKTSINSSSSRPREQGLNTEGFQNKDGVDPQDYKQNVPKNPFDIDLQELRAIYANRKTPSPSSSSASSRVFSSTSSIIQQGQAYFDNKSSQARFRAITLPIKYQPQKPPIIRIHHNSMTKYSKIAKNPSPLKSNQFQYLNPSLNIRSAEPRQLKNSKLKHLVIEGKKHIRHNRSGFSSREELPELKNQQQNRLRRVHTPTQQDQNYVKIEEQALELAGRAIDKVKRNQFFKMPKEKERILTIQLKQRILSDFESNQLKKRMEKAQSKRTGSCSMQRIRKVAVAGGIKLVRVENIAKRAMQKKREMNLAAFRNKIHQKPKHKLVIR